MEGYDPKEVGKRLRTLRGIRTRSGVAREIGINQNSLQTYENGSRNPSPERMLMLARYYGKSVEEIFFTKENN